MIMEGFMHTVIRLIFKLVFFIYRPKVRTLYKGRDNIDLATHGDTRIRVGRPFCLSGEIFKLDQRDDRSVFKLALYKEHWQYWVKADDLDLIFRLNAGHSIFYI